MQKPLVRMDERKGELERRELWLLIEEAILLLRLRGSSNIRCIKRLRGTRTTGLSVEAVDLRRWFVGY